MANTRLGQALDDLFIYSKAAEESFIGLQRFKLQPDEVLLLVSDGVTLYLSDDALAVCLAGTDLVADVRRLFDEVMTAGAENNLSAVAIVVK